MLGRTYSKYNNRYDHNVVTNEYKQNHEAKALQDWQTNMDGVIDRFWKQRVFDPLTQKYYNPALDAAVQEKDEERNTAIRSHCYDTLPPSLQQGLLFLIFPLLFLVS